MPRVVPTHLRRIAAGISVVAAVVLGLGIVVAPSFGPQPAAAVADTRSTGGPVPDAPATGPAAVGTGTRGAAGDSDSGGPSDALPATVSATLPATATATATATGTGSVIVPATGTLAPAFSGRTETVILAGGCFWGVQGVFQHVKGVIRAESGYTGGSADTADYAAVSTGTTGHAESVKVTYDPAQVTFEQILQIFFTVAHDPTELDRQGPDTGSQYRSAVFAQTADQERAAERYVGQLTRDAVFADPIVTRIGIDTDFYPAEAYHQDYLNSHPTYMYIAVFDQPKLLDLEDEFPALYSPTPVLITPAPN